MDKSKHRYGSSAPNFKHGFAKRGTNHCRLYRIWVNMRRRCRDKNCEAFKWYGAKGVSVCASWNDFAEFRKWAIENGYDSTLTIDRIDSDGSYTPENCRWITMREQQRNRKHCNVWITYGNKTMLKIDWTRFLGVSRTWFDSLIKKFNGDSSKAIEHIVLKKGIKL